MKAVLNVGRPRYPAMHVVAFVGGLHLVDASGQHDALAAGMTGSLSLLDRMGARYHA